MIGFYDYTVILTYVGLISAVFGMVQAVNGNYLTALLCLGITLVCDTLDGKVARSKKNRTKEETLFGVQIDSLCDVISFGAFPALLCYCMGLKEWYSLVILGYYCLCCVIRLGYFNVLALTKEPGAKAVYHGMPVVGLAMFLPAAFLLGTWLPGVVFLWLLRLMLLAFGTLYILDFQVEKPGTAKLAIMGILILVPYVLLFAMA